MILALLSLLLVAASSVHGSPPPSVVPNEIGGGAWIYVSHDSTGRLTETRLDKKQISSLIQMLNAHLKVPPPSGPQPKGSPPSVAPDLVINIHSQGGKSLGQVLGVNRDFITFHGLSIRDKKVVERFYDIVQKKRQPGGAANPAPPGG